MTFRVGLSRDLLGPDGAPFFGDIGLSSLDEAPGVEWEFLAPHGDELAPADLEPYDALLLLAPTVTAASLEGVDRLALIARLGVGYDRVDVCTCTERGVLLTLAPDGVRRPVAASAMAFVLALAHRLPLLDRLTREGRWKEAREHLGVGLSGRTLGLVGLGNIGREVVLLARAFGLRVAAADPYVDPAEAGVEIVGLDELFRTADFVCVTAPLTEETRHLVDAGRLALMKPSAYLVNVARGPIVDQRALTEALRERRIAGAALDVFEQEPPNPDDPLLALDNVILAPHAVCLTDEWALTTGRSACTAALGVAGGRVPRYVVNREALERPALQEKLRRYATREVGE